VINVRRLVGLTAAAKIFKGYLFDAADIQRDAARSRYTLRNAGQRVRLAQFPARRDNEGIASVRDGRVTCSVVELAPR
jgi:hypothetical protein